MRKSLCPRFDAALEQLIDNAEGHKKDEIGQAQERIAEGDELTERLIREGKLPPIKGWDY